MSKSSPVAIGFRFPDLSKLFLLGLYTLTFYLAPVLPHPSQTDEIQYSGSGNYHLINAFNDFFEFGDY
jgi:hypothetical protein